MLSILEGNICIYVTLIYKNMSTNNQQLTSVKVDKDLFEEFKINSIKMKFSLQKLSERAMFLYNTDPEFRKMIHKVEVNLKKPE